MFGTELYGCDCDDERTESETSPCAWRNFFFLLLLYVKSLEKGEWVGGWVGGWRGGGGGGGRIGIRLFILVISV